VSGNQQWLLARLPDGRLDPADFELRDGERPVVGGDQALCRTLWLSIDAAGRAWMQGPTYRDAMKPGDVMAGFGVAEVVESSSDRLAPGQLVAGEVGWQEYAALPVRALQPLAPRDDPADYLTVLGITGLTAYFGLLDVGRAREGETVVVSAAAGATGNLVGQIAKLQGCRTVGICGSGDKATWLLDDLGFDAVVNHRQPDLRRQLKAACPDGIDVYFDNVGGEVLEAALSLANRDGRVACCGAISQYDTTTPTPGPRGVPGLLVTRRLTMQGFIVTDFADRFPEALATLDGWLADGRLVATADVLEGLKRAPEALVGLLAGTNVGKRMVHVADAG
jgi:NADPH-dependent curcumin reductase CurA